MLSGLSIPCSGVPTADGGFMAAVSFCSHHGLSLFASSVCSARRRKVRFATCFASFSLFPAHRRRHETLLSSQTSVSSLRLALLHL